MAITVNDILTRVEDALLDDSDNSFSEAQKIRKISEATQTLFDELYFDFMNRTYTFDYFDNINYYDVTTDVPDMSDVYDLRRKETDHTIPFVKRAPREIATLINTGSDEPSLALERKNKKNYLVINYNSQYPATILHDCDTYNGNGTWTADETTSDATNVTTDDNEYEIGTGSVNFDIDVSQSANNRATIYIDDMAAVDLTDDEDLSSFIFRAYIPDVTYISSFTVYWGSSSSAYWTGSATADAYGVAFANGWNRIKVDWADTTQVGSPDVSAIDYIRIDVNYSASQGDDTDFRIDDITMARPEKLTLHYRTWYLGTNSSGTYLTEYTATGDIPFYSGIYDSIKNYVAHQAASYVLSDLREKEKSIEEATLAANALRRIKKNFPGLSLETVKSFKPRGITWN